MSNRRNANRGRARRRPRLPSPDLQQPINLIQLMRRRLRYRPYSVNNPNMRSAIGNNRNWCHPFDYNMGRNNIRPLFHTSESLERQDIGINTEIPCCAVHSSFISREYKEIIESLGEIEENNEELMPDIRESLYRLANFEGASKNSEGMKEKDLFVSESKGSAKERENLKSSDKSKASKSNESKSPDASSTEASGSSISYTESGHRSRKQNLLVKQYVEFPTALGEFTLDNSLGNPGFYEEDTGFNKSSLNNSESLKDLKNIETISEHYEFSDVEREKEASISPKNSQTDKSFVENLRDLPTESQETFSPEISIIKNPNIVACSELSRSSYETLEMATTTRFTFVEVHSNTSIENNVSGSSLENEENQATITPSDTEAGGDGHHNDSVINIEFTITATLHPDNEDHNNDDEGLDNESETNNEDQ